METIQKEAGEGGSLPMLKVCVFACYLDLVHKDYAWEPPAPPLM